jgi:hypothetical protein
MLRKIGKIIFPIIFVFFIIFLLLICTVFILGYFAENFNYFGFNF